MKKLLVLVAVVAVFASLAGCGKGSSSSSTPVPKTPDPADIGSVPVPGTKLGGAIQGTALPLGLQVTETLYPDVPLAGGAAGFSNVTSAGKATFNRPLAITTDGTNLYVADYLNNAIRQINIVSRHVTTIAGSLSGLAGSQNGTGNDALFYRPSAITTDGTNLYVADSFNYTIRKIVITTGVVSTLAGTAGQAGHVDETGTAARFGELKGITISGNYLYVTDSDFTIRMIHKDNATVNTLAGSPGNSGSADGAGAAARFNEPAQLTTDGPNLYVADFNNDTIRKIELVAGNVTTIAGKVRVAGEVRADVNALTGQDARFNKPFGITCDGFNLYVTGVMENNLRKIVLTPSGFSGPVTTLANFGLNNLNTIAGITTDGTSLYLTDIFVDNSKHVIRKIQ
jgi:hypothetical protein